jgi:Na+/proline symporter
VALPKPEDAAYAVASMQLLPASLVAVMMVAIFSATMSAMDHGINRNAAILVCDLYPLLCRAAGRRPRPPERLLGLSRVVTVLLGLAIAGIAWYLARRSGTNLFGLMLDVSAMLSVPLAVPLAWCLFLRRMPPWAAFAGIGVGFLVSIIGFYSGSLFGHPWNLQIRFFANLSGATVGCLATLPFWHQAPPAYRRKVAAFFERLHAPIDFAEEVGASIDDLQLRFAGAFCLVIGALIVGLSLLPDRAAHRLTCAALGSSVGALGALLRRRGKA